MGMSLEHGVPINLSATGTISKASSALLGFYVNSTNAGTLVIKSGSDGGSGGTAISGTITPAIGFHRFPAYCPSGCHATIGGSALDVTFFAAAG